MVETQTDKARLYVFGHQRFVGSVLVENSTIHDAQHDAACIGYEDHRIFTQNAIGRPVDVQKRAL